MPPFQKGDLTLLEQTVLGVLSCGIVPASLAKDESFRIDYIAAVCHAYREERPRDAHLREPDGVRVTPEFGALLQQALTSLDEKGIIGLHEPPALDLSMAGRPGAVEMVQMVETNRNPTVFDRYLGGVCLEDLMRHPNRDLYRFLMDRYAESGLIWQKLMRAGYGSGPLL